MFSLQTDVHLHCEEWDLALSRGMPWEPEAIVRKLPEFLEFVMEVQGHVFYEMNMVELRKTSTLTLSNTLVKT